MPAIKTRHFGPVEYREEDLFEFPEGLPGFEDQKRFLPLECPTSQPLVFLQSEADPGLCFITLPVRCIDPDYRPCISPEDLAELGLPEGRQPGPDDAVLLLAIVSVRAGRPSTANLLAPVAVNLKTRRALQAIQAGSGYSHQRELFAEEVALCS